METHCKQVMVYNDNGTVDYIQLLHRYDLIRRLTAAEHVKLAGGRESVRLSIAPEGLPPTQQEIVKHNQVFLFQMSVIFRGGAEIKFREWDNKESKYKTGAVVKRSDFLNAFDDAAKHRENGFDVPATLRADVFRDMEEAGKLDDHQKYSSVYKTACFLPESKDEKGDGIERVCPVIVFVPNPSVYNERYADIPVAFAAFEFEKKTNAGGVFFNADCYYPYYLTNFRQYNTFKLINPMGNRMQEMFQILTEDDFSEDDFGFNFDKFRNAEEIAKFMPAQFQSKFTSDVISLYDKYSNVSQAKPQLKTLFYEPGSLKVQISSYFDMVSSERGIRVKRNLYQKSEGDIDAELDFEPVKIGEKRSYQEASNDKWGDKEEVKRCQ